MLLLTDDRLVDSMRAFVIASNRLEHLVGRKTSDLRAVEQLAEERRLAGQALQEALVQRGWSIPKY